MNKLLIAGLLVLLITACRSGEQGGTSNAPVPHTCPMHPTVVQEGPGSCPICGMDLVPLAQNGNKRQIMLSERQMALGNIKVGEVAYGEIGDAIFLEGELKANQELTELISSRVQGRIEKLYVKEAGRPVRKGQALYEIYSEALLTLQKEYLLTLEQYRELGAENKRYASFAEAARKKLLLYGMTPEQVEQLAKTGGVSATVTFPAPASGVVAEVPVAEGQYVNEGTILYKIESLDRLWVEAALYPNEASLVKPGDKVQVIVNGFENEPRAGKVIFLNPEYKAGSQIITMRVEIANPGGDLIPGMQANVLLLDKESRRALVLPSDAVIRGENGAHVWVKTGEGTFEPRLVKTGLETFNKTAITEGLHAGDSVAFSGAYLLYGELVLKKGQEPNFK